MKKLLVILSAITLVLLFAACDTEDNGHAHSYTSEITSDALCDKEGIKTFTCACGDTYTEKIDATGHMWGEWTQTTAPSYTAQGEEERTCGSCSATEKRDVAQLSLENKFRSYPDKVHSLGFFSSVDELTSYDIFDWAINHIEPTSETKDFDNYIFAYTYSVDSINALSSSYLGETWGFSSITNPNPYSNTEYIYDAAKNTVTVVYNGAFGDAGPEITYTGYRAIDDNHFEISYSKQNFGDAPFNVVIKVEQRGDNFIITSQAAA